MEKALGIDDPSEDRNKVRAKVEWILRYVYEILKNGRGYVGVASGIRHGSWSSPSVDLGSSSLPCWKPPTEGWLKLNVDATYHLKRPCYGLGGIIRHDRGLLIIA